MIVKVHSLCDHICNQHIKAEQLVINEGCNLSLNVLDAVHWDTLSIDDRRELLAANGLVLEEAE